MTTLVSAGAELAAANGAPAGITTLVDRYNWRHLWVADMATTGPRTGAEWPPGNPVPDGTAVLEVPDLGTGGLPLIPDPDGSFGAVFFQTPMPPPLYVPASPRFLGRAAWHTDVVLASGAFFDNFHSMLAPLPKGDPLDIDQPYSWVCCVAFPADGDGIELTALDGDPGWLTVGPIDGHWEAAAWVSFPDPPDDGGKLIVDSIDHDQTSTFVLGGTVNQTSSSFTVARRTSTGQIERATDTGEQARTGLPAGPCHFGWSHLTIMHLVGVFAGELPTGVIDSVLDYCGVDGA